LENEEIFVPIVTDLLKNSIQQAVVPNKMKISVLRPVYKQGSHRDMANYRPIAIPTAMSKITEIYMTEMLDIFLDKQDIIMNNLGIEKK